MIFHDIIIMYYTGYKFRGGLSDLRLLTQDKHFTLTGKMFRCMVLSFFVSNIMTVLGAMMDSFTASNVMDEATAAAVGFVSPAVILFSLIGTTAAVGFQVTCIDSLSRGDRESAGKALCEALIFGLVISVIVMILTLVFTPQIVVFLRVSPDNASFGHCVDYLRGTVLGLPAITAMAIFTKGAHIEGNRSILLLSVAVMLAVNILSDLAGLYLFHFGVFGITLDTSFSYYAGTAVLVHYYFRKDALVKPVFRGTSLKGMISVNWKGFAAAVIVVWYSLTLMMKAEVINVAVSLYDMESIGLLAYNVTVQINYFVNALMSSAVSAMFLLAGMFSAEQDKKNFKKIITNVVAYEFIITAVCSLFLWLFSDVIAGLYLGNVSRAVTEGTAQSLRAYTVGLLFQMIVLVFANYIQCFNHNIIPVIVFFISNVLLVLFGAGYGAAIAIDRNINATAGIFAGVSAGSIISALILPVFIAIISHRNGCRYNLWMFPKDFGVSPDDEISADIRTLKEVQDFSVRAWQFCVDKGAPERITYLTSLSVEEMANNVIEHGFTKDKKDHLLNARVVHKGDEIIIRMRDNCRSFDPRIKYQQIYGNDNPGSNCGIKMIMAEASEVNYTTMFNLNNLLIRIFVPYKHK